MHRKLEKTELLAPAGNLEKLKIALKYGADAVYMGDKTFSLRGGTDNFTKEELEEGIKYAHELGKKAYATVNIYANNEDLEKLPAYVRFLDKIEADGAIVSDPAVVQIIKKETKNLPVFLSTQTNTTNYLSAKFWEEQGISRIILARELSLIEIKEIKKQTNLELEIFIHGSVCISHSGRCYISKYLLDRDANRGECTHPCRWNYHLMEETREGEYFPVFEDNRGTYIYNSKDLCLMPRIKDLIETGIESFKIEGRMKSVHYLATVVSVYRAAIDSYFNDPKNFIVKDEWLAELFKVKNRGYFLGFVDGKPSLESMSIDKADNDNIKYKFCGQVLEDSQVLVKNQIKLDDNIEIFNGKFHNKTFVVKEMKDLRGKDLEVANPNSVIRIKNSEKLGKDDLLRLVIK